MPVPHSSLRVLITCREFSRHAGSELYTRDLAFRLRALGHRPVIFSPQLGDIAAETRSRGIPIIDDLDHPDTAPDVIHGQHHLAASAAIVRFPRTPALYVCHGWLPWQEAPPRFPSIRKYIAVSGLSRDRLVIEHGIPEDETETIYNFVDLDRFRPRSPLPERPSRALLFSNQATAGNFTRDVQAACASFDIALDVIGIRTGAAALAPETILGHYDLVFGRGRCALEAMAVGAAVILCDIEGSGPFVDSSAFDRLRSANFGMAALQPPVDAERLRSEIARYDPHEAALVRDRVRSECGLDDAVARIVALYEEILDTPVACDPSATLNAAARYLTWLGPFTESAVCDEIGRGMRPRLECAHAEWEAQIEAVRNELRLAKSEIGHLARHATLLDDALGEARDRLASQKAILDSQARELALQSEAHATTTRAFDQLQRSPFSRLRARLLRIGPLVALYRFAIRRPLS